MLNRGVTVRIVTEYRKVSGIAALFWSCSVLLLLPGVGQAQSPSTHQFRVDSRIELDQNPRLTTGVDTRVWVLRTNPVYSFVRQDGASTWSLSAAVNLEQSSDRSQRGDRQDPSLVARYEEKASRGAWLISASAARESTREAELDTIGGLLTDDQTQTTLELTWNAQRELSERLTLSGGTNFRDVQYNSRDLIEHQIFEAELALTYALSEFQDLSLQAVSKLFEPRVEGIVQSAEPSRLTTVLVDYSQIWSPLWESRVSLGVVSISGLNAGGAWQGEASVSYTGERFGGSLEGGRASVSSGVLGGFLTTDVMRARGNYTWSDRAQLELNWTRSLSRGDVRLQDSSTTTGITVSIDLTQEWKLALRLQERQVRRASGRASGTLVGLNLVYFNPDW